MFILAEQKTVSKKEAIDHLSDIYYGLEKLSRDFENIKSYYENKITCLNNIFDKEKIERYTDNFKAKAFHYNNQKNRLLSYRDFYLNILNKKEENNE